MVFRVPGRRARERDGPAPTVEALRAAISRTTPAAHLLANQIASEQAYRHRDQVDAVPVVSSRESTKPSAHGPGHPRASNRGQRVHDETPSDSHEKADYGDGAGACAIPKLTVRVRFPSPAPQRKPRSRPRPRIWASLFLIFAAESCPHVPLALPLGLCHPPPKWVTTLVARGPPARSPRPVPAMSSPPPSMVF